LCENLNLHATYSVIRRGVVLILMRKWLWTVVVDRDVWQGAQLGCWFDPCAALGLGHALI
jgi:hypothetical protein